MSSSAVHRPNIVVAITAGILGFVIGNTFGNRGDTRAAEATMRSNIAAISKEDRAAMLASFHSKSPYAGEATKLYDALMPRLDVNAEMVSFEPLGASGDLLVARYMQRTFAKATSKGPFVDNEIDGIAIFNSEGGVPKLWMTVPISAREIVAVGTATAVAAPASATTIK